VTNGHGAWKQAVAAARFLGGTGGVAVFLLLGAAGGVCQAQEQNGVPVFELVRPESKITFKVNASVKVEGTFEKWDAALTFGSRDALSGRLNIDIHADSVHTGSGLRDAKLRGKDFFYAEENPSIKFESRSVEQTSATTLKVAGDFTIRGVTKPETLYVTIAGKGTGKGTIKGTMEFNRRDYGMNKGIPFVRIGDRVDVTVDLKVRQMSGARLAYKQ
jgi:polyisoprenoid-binding protein YceI